VGFFAVDIFWLLCHIFFICFRAQTNDAHIDGSTGSVRFMGQETPLFAAADKRLAMGKGDAANQGIGATCLQTGRNLLSDERRW
jgi:hypothetical protein